MSDKIDDQQNKRIKELSRKVDSISTDADALDARIEVLEKADTDHQVTELEKRVEKLVRKVTYLKSTVRVLEQVIQLLRTLGFAALTIILGLVPLLYVLCKLTRLPKWDEDPQVKIAALACAALVAAIGFTAGLHLAKKKDEDF